MDVCSSSRAFESTRYYTILSEGFQIIGVGAVAAESWKFVVCLIFVVEPPVDVVVVEPLYRVTLGASYLQCPANVLPSDCEVTRVGQLLEEGKLEPGLAIYGGDAVEVPEEVVLDISVTAQLLHIPVLVSVQ